MVGSEGTLGVRRRGDLPDGAAAAAHASTRCCVFDDLYAANRALPALVATGARHRSS